MDMSLKWYSLARAPFELEGFPFFGQEGLYRRLSVNPPKPLPAGVEGLSWDTAGAQVRFRVKTKKMMLSVHLRNGHVMDHMAGTGESGFDLYLSRTEDQPRYYCTARFEQCARDYESVMMDRPEAEWFEAVLNFPLYDGVQEVLIGLDADAEIAPPTPRKNSGRIVVYGTSITQGGCATRPGMGYTNILSRMLDMEVVNEGFSGSGCCEEEAALALRDIPDMKLFILDTEANVGPLEHYITRYPRVLDLIREVYPELPILVVSKVPYAKELLDEPMRVTRLEKKKLQKALVEKRRAEGDVNIYFMDGEDLYPGDFEEYAVDGVHATDLGFLKMAQGFAPVIREILHLA